MKKLIAFFSIVAVMAVNAHAAVTIDFTEVDLGYSDLYEITDQWEDYGLTFVGVCRYIDDRDHWLEKEIYGELYGYGITNTIFTTQGDESSLGRVDFTTPVYDVEIDWWVVAYDDDSPPQPTILYLDVYGSSILDSFIFDSSNLPDPDEITYTYAYDEDNNVYYGTVTLSGGGDLISYLTFHNDGGYVQIANMTFSPIPAPGAILLGGIGVTLVGWLRRRKIL